MRCVGREGKHTIAKGARGERWEGGRGREGGARGAAHVRLESVLRPALRMYRCRNGIRKTFHNICGLPTVSTSEMGFPDLAHQI